MRLQDQEWITATPDQTWQALLDPSTLQQCFKDCKRVERVSDSEYHFLFDTSSNDGTSEFAGVVLIQERQAPGRLRFAFNGSGAHQGLAIGLADLSLAPGVRDGTRITYTLEAAAGGALARLGEDELRRRAGRHLEGFFLRLSDLATQMPTHLPPAQTPNPVAEPPGRAWAGWLVALAILGAIVFYFVFTRP